MSETRIRRYSASRGGHAPGHVRDVLLHAVDRNRRAWWGELGDPMVTEEHITAFNWASTQEIDDILATTLRVNDFLAGLFGGVGITLVDFKLEFGRVWEQEFSRVILADEISPDSCRLWDTISNEKLDKDRFRRDMGNVVESYTEVARRLGIMKEMPTVIQGGLH